MAILLSDRETTFEGYPMTLAAKRDVETDWQPAYKSAARPTALEQEMAAWEARRRRC